MEQRDVARVVTPEAVSERVARFGPALRQLRHEHGGPTETVRRSTYRGHEIVIRTTYRIEVDGVPVDGHVGVASDGQVHYHAIPNLSFASAVDLVEQLIEAFPEDFSPGEAVVEDEGL
ncbi:MAG: hypothetical protein M3O70_26235 [Actinomycetota bacterium]|nr:hypothetical protein [Actinomycetota bacterium]